MNPNPLPGDSHFVVIDSIDQAGGTLYRVLQYDRMSQNTLVPIYDVPTDVRSLESGSHHVLALTISGELYAWGDNHDGQLGNINAGDSSVTPVRVVFADGVKIKSIAAGARHNFAIDTDNRVWVWGRGTEGQLGIAGSLENIPEPVLLPMPVVNGVVTPLTVFATGKNHSFALQKNGKLWSWGKMTKGNC